MAEKPPLSNDNQIAMYLHCVLCVHEWVHEWSLGGTVSPAEAARLAVGWTPRGLQVWCERHKVNVCNIDFEGHRHPADSTRKSH